MWLAAGFSGHMNTHTNTRPGTSSASNPARNCVAGDRWIKKVTSGTRSLNLFSDTVCYPRLLVRFLIVLLRPFWNYHNRRFLKKSPIKLQRWPQLTRSDTFSLETRPSQTGSYTEPEHIVLLNANLHLVSIHSIRHGCRTSVMPCILQSRSMKTCA
jgi:hypothetical protein